MRNYHKLSGLRQHKCITLQFHRSEVQVGSIGFLDQSLTRQKSTYWLVGPSSGSSRFRLLTECSFSPSEDQGLYFLGAEIWGHTWLQEVSLSLALASDPLHLRARNSVLDPSHTWDLPNFPNFPFLSCFCSYISLDYRLKKFSALKSSGD